MHMRRKNWAKPELEACPYYTDDPERFRGIWREQFVRRQPLHIELGCGKGVSTAQMVSRNRDVNYLAIDLVCDVLGYARRNMEAAYEGAPVDNALIVKENVSFIDRMFAPEDRVDRIYINFPVPWSGQPHEAKHRFTHPRLLTLYRNFMAADGEIWFKTDDEKLFRDSLTYFSACGFQARYLTGDLYASRFSPNYASEYELKFARQGLPIRFGIFRMLPDPPELDAAFWHIGAPQNQR